MNTDRFRQVFGAVIESRRVKLKLSPEKLEANAGISLSSLEKIEEGNVRVPLATVFDLAKALGCRGWILVREAESKL